MLCWIYQTIIKLFLIFYAPEQFKWHGNDLFLERMERIHSEKI